jgi:hypothetical protein
MKNLSHLNLSEEILQATEAKDEEYRLKYHIGCDVLAVEGEAVVMRILQFRAPDGVVYTRKELLEKAKEVCSLLEGYTIKWRPLTWKGHGPEIVDASYVRTNLRKHGLSHQQFATAVLLDEHKLLQVFNGQVGFSEWEQEKIFYFFMELRNQQKA